MRPLLVTLAMLVLPTLAAAQTAPAATFQPREDADTNYPDHPGREETYGFCTACHGFRIVAAQGMTREQWDGSLIWMTQRHNMPPIDGSERDLILDYLAKAFPPKAPAASRPGWRNPFGPQ